ncbi:MAG: 50S ribosomal protein L21 [Saprospiraceae bacterium]|nr:50S ribosomal protein L21 [Saprospiraceae bacterium]
MFAIVTIAGQQFKVTEGQELFVHRLEAAEGASVSFDQVHLVDRSGSVTVGTPIVKGAKIGATVLDPLVKGDKVIVFKKKRRKGYRVKKGHRQQFSKIKINSITA